MARLINKDELLNSYKLTRPFYLDGMPVSVYIKQFRDVIEDAPEIDIFNHAKWLHSKEERSFGLANIITCSNCGRKKLKGSSPVPRFCEDCGCKMEDSNGETS